MPTAEFEPAFPASERTQTHTFDDATKHITLVLFALCLTPHGLIITPESKHLFPFSV
jgi:hypothetical protein